MEKKQIFSIRKLTVGAASVMIGATLLGANVQNSYVKAASEQKEKISESSKMADKIKINLPTKKIIIDSDPNRVSAFFMVNQEVAARGAGLLRSINPDLYGKASIKIYDDQQIYLIVFSDQSVKKIPYNEVFASSDAYRAKINKPEFPMIVRDSRNLSSTELAKIISAIKELNPLVKSVEYSKRYFVAGPTQFKLTYADGSVSPSESGGGAVQWINLSDWAVSFSSKNNYGQNAKSPDKKIKANNPEALSSDEKSQIISNVRQSNADASLVEVSDQGLVRVKYDSGAVSYIAPYNVLTNSNGKPLAPSQPNKPSNPGTDNPSTPSNPGSDVPNVPSTPEIPSTPTAPKAPSTPINNNQKPTSNNTKEEALSTVLYAPVINGNRNWKIALRDSNGKLTGKYIATGTSWKVFGKKMINGVLYYRLGSQQQWVPAEYLTKGSNSSTAETKLSTTGYVARLANHPTWKIALYNSQGKVTGYLKPNSNWKVLASKKINGRLMYRLGTDSQWIPAQYIAVK